MEEVDLSSMATQEEICKKNKNKNKKGDRTMKNKGLHKGIFKHSKEYYVTGQVSFFLKKKSSLFK